jgi:hypothetical protein
MKKIIVLLLTIGLAVVPLSCTRRVSLNPQVNFANTLLAAADAVDVVATALVAANQVIESLKTQEPDYFNATKPKLVAIAKANDKAIAVIRSAQSGDTSVDWRGAVLAVSTTVANQDQANFGFKNPNTQATVKIGLASLQAALIAIQNSFGK